MLPIPPPTPHPADPARQPDLAWPAGRLETNDAGEITPESLEGVHAVILGQEAYVPGSVPADDQLVAITRFGCEADPPTLPAAPAGPPNA